MRPQREQSLTIRNADDSHEHSFSYVLPLNWSDDLGRAELAGYLEQLAETCPEIIIVDGSPAPVFAENHRAFGDLVSHVRLDPEAPGKMQKVPAVMTGIRLASNEAVVIADDDVRYDSATLFRAIQLLESADMVRPQNYFEPLPWHARWDTARTLLNRSVGADFPGTLIVRRSTLLAAGGYDPDVLFENLELIRTIRAAGGRVLNCLDLYVRRLPPPTGHFLEQRPRQAYEDFAIPARMCCWLAILPALVVSPRHRKPILFALGVGATLVAEGGRRRGGGRQVFPASSAFFAPVWLLERSICAWLAVLARLRHGGLRYRGSVIFTSANSVRTLRRRIGDP